MDRFRRLLLEKLAPLRPYTSHLAVLGLAAALGLIVGAFKVAGSPPAIDTADRWPFPQWAPFRSGAQREALARTALWVEDPTKAKAAVAEKKPEGPPWRFIGTLQEGSSRIAVIELDQGKRIQRIGPGQPLPNGALITKVEANILAYDDDGVERLLKLFGLTKNDNLPIGTGKK